MIIPLLVNLLVHSLKNIYLHHIRKKGSRIEMFD